MVDKPLTEKQMESLERLINAEERSHPLRLMLRKGEAWMIEELKIKAPDLVQPLHSIFLLHFGELDSAFNCGPELIPMERWNLEIEKLQKLVRQLSGRELQDQDLPRHSDSELPPWMILD